MHVSGTLHNVSSVSFFIFKNYYDLPHGLTGQIL